MNRSILALLALVALLLLTAATWAVADGSAATLALVAAAKIVVIGLVFLDLDRAWPGWGALYVVLVGGVLGGAVLLVGG